MCVCVCVCVCMCVCVCVCICVCVRRVRGGGGRQQAYGSAIRVAEMQSHSFGILNWDTSKGKSHPSMGESPMETAHLVELIPNSLGLSFAEDALPHLTPAGKGVRHC